MSNLNEPRAHLVQELNQALQRSGNLTVLFTHAIAEHIGLSATEFESLDVLRQHGPMTAGQLAKACGLSTGGVTGMVDRLEKAGFVRRVADQTDRRKVIIEFIPNETIRQQIVQLYGPVSTGFAQIAAQYSDQEIEIILGFINRTSVMVEQVRTHFKNG
jgi:DNA-binding MarR family transcriptional regulator